jgi:hypothetical protein
VQPRSSARESQPLEERSERLSPCGRCSGFRRRPAASATPDRCKQPGKIGAEDLGDAGVAKAALGEQRGDVQEAVRGIEIRQKGIDIGRSPGAEIPAARRSATSAANFLRNAALKLTGETVPSVPIPT